MEDASSLLSNAGQLEDRRANEGYLYLRGAIDSGAIAWARGEMIAALVEEGQLDRTSLESHGRGEIDTHWTGRRVEGIGIPGRQAQASFKKRRIWETFVEMPEVRKLFETVAGGPVNFLPISEYRSLRPACPSIRTVRRTMAMKSRPRGSR